MNNAPRLPDPWIIPTLRGRSWFDPCDGKVSREIGATPGTDEVLVRPFIVTEGRTRPLHKGLRVDTLVQATAAALSVPLEFERRRIIELCQNPLSVAEVAAGLALPLGVVRVLIGDLVNEKLLLFQEHVELPIQFIERIRDLVRAL